jgi:hypothetical protein
MLGNDFSPGNTTANTMAMTTKNDHKEKPCAFLDTQIRAFPLLPKNC